MNKFNTDILILRRSDLIGISKLKPISDISIIDTRSSLKEITMSSFVMFVDDDNKSCILLKHRYDLDNYQNDELIDDDAKPAMLEALLEAKRMYEAIEPVGGWQGVYELIESAINRATK